MLSQILMHEREQVADSCGKPRVAFAWHARDPVDTPPVLHQALTSAELFRVNVKIFCSDSLVCDIGLQLRLMSCFMTYFGIVHSSKHAQYCSNMTPLLKPVANGSFDPIFDPI